LRVLPTPRVKCKGLLGESGDGDVGAVGSIGIDFDRENGVTPAAAPAMVGDVTGGVKEGDSKRVIRAQEG
jgi:hypothetical protein